MDGDSKLENSLYTEQSTDLCKILEIENEFIGSGNKSKSNIVGNIRKVREDYRNIYLKTIDRLRRLGLADHILIAAQTRIKTTGASLIYELTSSGQLDLHSYYCLLAADLELSFETFINPNRIWIDVSSTRFRPGRRVQVCCRDNSGGLVLHMAPDMRTERQLFSLFERNPAMRARFCICDPQTILAAIETKLAPNSVDAAISKLHTEWPHLSAKDTFIPWQAFVFGIFIVLFPMCLSFAFWPTLFVVHVLSIVLFGMTISIRLAAWRSVGSRIPSTAPVIQSSNFPVYSVLIALNKEAAVVPQLVRAMARIDWPPSRLELFYVCEADDAETISAFESIRLPEAHRVICIPAASPRTKPKALNYALGMTTGDFVVIYDAEDRPHPQQLKEAWARFCGEPEDLVCLQAPLHISNASQSWLSRLFAFEYAAHFHGLLPYLAAANVPLPLGGTSNHFRRSALVESLGWDPYNVTEDADLGIRLHRLGYRCGVLECPTLEDAPTKLSQWLPQRTRWLKGWMQTLLVHNRDFGELSRLIGIKNNIIFQILMAGFILSPLLYGISIIEILYFCITFEDNEAFGTVFIYIDLTIFLLGHIGYSLLALACWRRVSQKSAAGSVATLPVYWLLASVAAWRAVWKLVTAPHQWEKTSHQVAFTPRSKVSRSETS